MWLRNTRCLFVLFFSEIFHWRRCELRTWWLLCNLNIDGQSSHGSIMTNLHMWIAIECVCTDWTHYIQLHINQSIHIFVHKELLIMSTVSPAIDTVQKKTAVCQHNWDHWVYFLILRGDIEIVLRRAIATFQRRNKILKILKDIIAYFYYKWYPQYCVLNNLYLSHNHKKSHFGPREILQGVNCLQWKHKVQIPNPHNAICKPTI